MKQNILILVLLITILILTGCKEEVVKERDYTQLNLAEQEYIRQFGAYLNTGEVGSLIAIDQNKNDVDNIEISSNNDCGEPIEEGVEEAIVRGNYPIIDAFGTIYAYGTKEESDKSYKTWEEYPEFSIKYMNIQPDAIYFKIYNKQSQSTQMYKVVINENNQIVKYSIMQ